jgi:adenylate kinase
MSTPTVFFILGGPGSGKGTCCERLVKSFGFVHISAGDLLREETKKDTDLAKLINERLAAGQIVPSEITVKLLQNAMAAAPSEVGYLVDGFPRKFDQAAMFEEQTAKAKAVLYFDCSMETMEKRLLGRGRADDNPETVRRRFQTNVEQCMPVVEMYQKEGRARPIDANQDVPTVFGQAYDIFTKEFGFVDRIAGGAKAFFLAEASA